MPRQATGKMESHTSPSRDQRDVKDNGAQCVARQPILELHVLKSECHKCGRIGHIKSVCLITDIIDRHAPLKRKRRRADEAPYMNSTYRKAIRLKTKLRSEFFKMKTPTNWELYRKQRNLCTSMRRQAVNCLKPRQCCSVTTDSIQLDRDE